MAKDNFSFGFVLRAFERYRHDVLLFGEWYEYLRDRGIPEEKFREVTLEFDKRGYLAYTIYSSVFLEDFDARAERYGSSVSVPCKEVPVCVLGTPSAAKDYRDDTVVVYFWDGSFLTYGKLKLMVEGAFEYFSRDIVSRLEFMGFLMRFYEYSLERASIVSYFPTVPPNVEHGWLRFSEIEDSLSDLGLLDLAKKWVMCLRNDLKADSSPAFVWIDPEYADSE